MGSTIFLMKLLFLTSRLPYPLDKGDKLRAYHFIKEISKFHEVVLFSLNDEETANSSVQELEKYCSLVVVHQLSKWTIYYNLFKNIFSRKPFQVAYFTNRIAKKKFEKLVAEEKPDVLFYQLVRMAEYGAALDLPKALDYMDVLSVGIQKRVEQERGLKKWVFALEHSRLKKYEAAVFHRFKKHFIITEQDRDQIPHPSKDKIQVLSNGVDLTYYQPPSEKNLLRYDIIFSGNMAYPPNIICAEYLVKQVMPLVWKIKHEATVAIVGTSPTSAVLDLASNKVIVTGRVDDMRTYFYQANVFAGPLFMNTGLQNKLLESMAMGVPCVTSTKANNALKGEANKDILIADDAEGFASAILFLMTHEQERNTLAKNALEFVTKHHHWTSIAIQLKNELESIQNT